MTDYVVLALTPLDTAVIPAESMREAIEKYELPGEFRDDDIFTVAMTADEFFEIFKKHADDIVGPSGIKHGDIIF